MQRFLFFRDNSCNFQFKLIPNFTILFYWRSSSSCYSACVVDGQLCASGCQSTAISCIQDLSIKSSSTEALVFLILLYLFPSDWLVWVFHFQSADTFLLVCKFCSTVAGTPLPSHSSTMGHCGTWELHFQSTEGVSPQLSLDRGHSLSNGDFNAVVFISFTISSCQPFQLKKGWFIKQDRAVLFHVINVLLRWLLLVQNGGGNSLLFLGFN